MLSIDDFEKQLVLWEKDQDLFDLNKLLVLERSIESKAAYIPKRILSSLLGRIEFLKKAHDGNVNSLMALELGLSPITTALSQSILLNPIIPSLSTVLGNGVEDLVGTNLNKPGIYDSFTFKNCSGGADMKIGPCKGAVFIEKCKDCKMTVAAHQIRLVNCYNIILHAFSATSVILEDCRDIKIDEIVPWYEEYENDMIKADLMGPNNYRNQMNFTDF